MNNITLGNDRFTYYETLGGGQGACADADGPSAVHVAMSNTLNTPIEALELEFPLRAVEYALRRGSGGAGRQRGGDGVIRELEALDEMRYSLITERRRHSPPGADGGEPGRPGRNLLNGEELPAKASGTLSPGDRLRIETPGGGGHGSRDDKLRAHRALRQRRVAFCGLGIMGGPMAANLARAGFELSVYTRTKEKAERFAEEHGASAAATPREAAEGASVVITMVPDAPEVEEVLLGEQGAVHGLGDGALAIDMSTIAPTAARAIGERLADDGVAFLEAPVSGSRPKAEDGTLTIMVGGAPEDFERARPLFDAMGERIVHVGPQGHAQLAKLLTNTMGAVHAVALAESVLAAERAGLDPDAFLEVAAGSAGNSTVLGLKGRPMFDRDFKPLFKLEHMLKDVRHCLDEARALGVELRLGSLVEPLYTRAAENGHAEDDFAAVIRALE